ncbi:MAG: hypothetical protein ACTS27_07370 [Phycisphaerales bacterium]
MSENETPAAQPNAAGPDPLAQTETRLNKGWMLKMGIFMVILLVFGFWGLYDALVAYPNRGKADAEYRELVYLSASRDAGQLLRADVANPRDELERLRGEERELRATANSSETSPAALNARAEAARLDWLTSLSRIGRLNAENTTFENPTERREALDAEWQTRTPPKPLSAFDIPSQWLFVIAGFGGAAWLTFLFVRVSSKKYRWDPATRTLTVPGGHSFTPSEITEVDKRKWDKYFVTIRLNESASAPKEQKFDLLRYSPLEAWILDMEKHSPNYVPPQTDEPDDEGEPSETEKTASA